MYKCDTGRRNDSEQAFESEEEHMEYLKRIAPRRELVCPITQELLRDLQECRLVVGRERRPG